MENFAASFDAECPIHMGPMENPRMLPCGHEFCTTCLIFMNARNRGRIICPTCKFSMRTVDVYELPLGASPNCMKINIQCEFPEEISQVFDDLENVAKSCDETVQKLEEMSAELLGIKASTEEKRYALEDIAYEKDNKRGVPATEVCNFMQKSTQMLQNELFLQLHNHLPKFFSAIKVYKSMEIPVFKIHPDFSERSEEIFKFASSLFLQLPTGEYGLLADSLAKYLQNSLPDNDNRVWTVVAGEKGYWTSHGDYLSLDLGAVTISACPCTSDNPIPINKEEMDKFLLENSTQSLLQWKNEQCNNNPTLFVQKQLEVETSLHWHCVAGDKGKFCLESGKPLTTKCQIYIGDLCFVVWQS